MSDTDTTESSETSEEVQPQTPREKAVMYSNLRLRALRDTIAITDAQLAVLDTISILREECKECRKQILCNPADMDQHRKLQVAEDTLYDAIKQSIQLDKDYKDAEERYFINRQLSKFWSNVDKI